MILFILMGAYYVIFIVIFKEYTFKYQLLAFIFYYLFLTLVLLVGRQDQGVAILQLNPLACFREIYYGSMREWMISGFNFIYFIFMPVVNTLFVRFDKINFMISFLIGLMFEFLQLIFHRGVFDLGDLLLYDLGIIVGILIMKKMKQA